MMCPRGAWDPPATHLLPLCSACWQPEPSSGGDRALSAAVLRRVLTLPSLFATYFLFFVFSRIIEHVLLWEDAVDPFGK